MSKFMILLKQNYRQKLKAKSFIITTIIYILGISTFIFWSDIKEALFSDEPEKMAYVNETNFDVSGFFVNDGATWTAEKSRTEAEKALQDGDYEAAIMFNEQQGTLVADVVSFDPLPLKMQQMLSTTISGIGQFYAMDQVNLSAEQSEKLLNSAPVISMVTLNETAVEGKSEEQKSAGIIASYIVGFIIYFFIISYLSIITTDVASEKGSRALEMLLVSVKPETHFKAKVASIFVLAITQFVILLGTFFVLLKLSGDVDKLEMVSSLLADLSGQYVMYVVVFLFVTIFLFLIIGALFGSLVSKVEEASQVMTPAMIIIIVGFYVMISATSNPDTILIKVFSYIPFTSGMVMPMRIGATDLAAIEPILSLGLLVVFTIGMYLLSMSFYKRSVLTYSTGGLMQKIKTVFKVTT
ncbi:ABC transporter permease [Solibacillus sp. CAU 1738]|uniref:ABC transporter permease n=1 Tax=Solibacillus sp. CAU 1738 TaxID=3140363 RepID=UPI0032614546